ncbi:MAG: DUF4440 domain-containing protein [Bacteroidia bacterium]|jgi:ketosteroid isomerase-like protein
MKNTLAFFILLCASTVQAQPHKLTDAQMIRRVLLMQEKAWNAGDLPAFMEGYWKNDSLQFIGKKGITLGWQQTLDNYIKSYPDQATMGQLQFEILKLEMFSKTTAQVIGKWTLIRSVEKGNAGGYFTLIFKKINKRWVIVSDHTS